MQHKYFIIPLLLLLTSCSTLKHDQRSLSKVHYRHPLLLAQYCAEHYDPTDSVHVQTEYIQGEDVVFTDTVTEVLNLTDTVTMVKYITRTVKTTDTVRDVKYEQVVNKAGIGLLQDKLQASNTNVIKLTASRNTYRWWTSGLGGLILLVVGWKIFKMYLKR